MASIETLLNHSTDDLIKLIDDEAKLLAEFGDAFNLEHKLIDEGLSKPNPNSGGDPDAEDEDSSDGTSGDSSPRIKKAKPAATKDKDTRAREKIEKQKAELLELAKLLNMPEQK